MLKKLNKSTYVGRIKKINQLVSIIIPIYNGEKYLKDTIESCTSQNYNELEIILIDDFSNDNSLSIVKVAREKDRRIVFFQNTSNQGMIKSLNQGILKSKGKYIICLGQDDILHPNHIKEMSGFMSPEVALAFCQSDLINENGDIYKINNHPKTEKVDLFELAKGNRINSCGLLMNREYINLVNGYPEMNGFPNYGEWLMWIKLASVGKIVYVKTIKSFYRRHDTNISKSFYNIINRKKLWIYYSHCRKTARALGKFSKYQKIKYSIYSVIFTLKFVYRSFHHRNAF